MVILFIAAEGRARDDVASMFVRLGHEVVAHVPGAVPPPPLWRDRVDVVVLDLHAGVEALRFLRRRRSEPWRLPVVCLANATRSDLSADALRLGVADIVVSPITEA